MAGRRKKGRHGIVVLKLQPRGCVTISTIGESTELSQGWMSKSFARPGRIGSSVVSFVPSRRSPAGLAWEASLVRIPCKENKPTAVMLLSFCARWPPVGSLNEARLLIE